MSFTDQKPRIATEADIAWAGYRDNRNFRCGFCGHRFKFGDRWRWVYTNDTPDAGGNPFVCANCDDSRENLLAKWQEMHRQVREFKEKFWWFFRR